VIALLQRVSCAHVDIDRETVGQIKQGILALIGVEPDDNHDIMQRLLGRILGYRIFEDEQGKMNLSLKDVAGGLLLVPQFTLAADTRSGMRPGFSTAAPPRLGEELFEAMVNEAGACHSPVASGRFGADMQVHLVNDGPVTFWLQGR
jgi:D-tyrosyl-tRNA(Tyr) deacylase